MSETYEIYTPNGLLLDVDKNTNKIHFADDGIGVGKYTKEYSKALLEAWKIMENSPYKSYKPLFLDPTLKTGQSSTYLEFKAWQDLYLKEPIRGSIAPWTKAEKAYYESLKTKRERYKYLVIRSGLRSSVIDIPYDAYAGVDENGKLINKEYAPLYEEVEANRGMANMHQGWLSMAEWELAAGILGDIQGFIEATQLRQTGFKARLQAISFLLLQLGYKEVLFGKNAFESFLADSFTRGGGLIDGMYVNALRALQIKEFSKNPPYDEYGMLPYLDELIGVDWVMDFNDYEALSDGEGYTIRYLSEQIKQGKLKDPRDKDSTKESREEFLNEAYGFLNGNLMNYDCDLSNDMSEKGVEFHINLLLLEAKVMSITPPQGYSNAPIYYIPEDLEDIYKRGRLDKRLNPTIPAMYRENFPEYLRKEIEDYARKHNIDN